MTKRVSTQQIRRELGLQYFSQWENDADYDSGPWNECSYSSMAIALSGLGFIGSGNGMFADQLEREFEARSLTRGSPTDMRNFMNEVYGGYGVRASFTFTASLQGVIDAIDAGMPVILHTDLTPSGHVIAVNGYDSSMYRNRGALLCHDPNGEWFSDGYQTNLTGQNVAYSFDLCNRLMGPDGGYWMHTLLREET